MQITLHVTVQVKDGNLVLTDRAGKPGTFSKDHTVPKKVSRITLGALCDLPKRQLATCFGCKTRQASYAIRNAVLHGAPADRWPKRPGPHAPSQRTKALAALIIRQRFETDCNLDEIAEALLQRGFQGSARLVGQVLADDGLANKNGGHPRHSRRDS